MNKNFKQKKNNNSSVDKDKAQIVSETPEIVSSLFAPLTQESIKLLEQFEKIVQGVFPFNGKQQKELPYKIRELSSHLTNERSQRRLGYMNETSTLSAYIRYFMWWNLVRFVPIFSGLNTFNPQSDEILLDIGSGPLTVPIALWIARPDLREKQLTWYCLDYSQTALSVGENIFLSLVAHTGGEPWKIIRVKGAMGTKINKKADTIICANMFNELFWGNPQPIEALVKKYTSDLFSYASQTASILIAEPGIPQSGHFISLMRDTFLRKSYTIHAPCPHQNECPMSGKRHGKWCHFTLSAKNAPKLLQKISYDAGLPKEHITLSLLFVSKSNNEQTINNEQKKPTDSKVKTRIVSDIIFLKKEDNNTIIKKGAGRYSCSHLGLILVGGYGSLGYSANMIESGDLVYIEDKKDKNIIDAKSKAIIAAALSKK